jgi:hypothetical protein
MAMRSASLRAPYLHSCSSLCGVVPGTALGGHSPPEDAAASSASLERARVVGTTFDVRARARDAFGRARAHNPVVVFVVVVVQIMLAMSVVKDVVR